MARTAVSSASLGVALGPASEQKSPEQVRSAWLDAFRRVRAETEARAAHLSAEDQQIQSMADASPTKWHRAHVTWFFEQFLLRPHDPGYAVFDERFPFLFNSYYVAAGPRHARPQRGMITRPTADDVTAYRAHVDAAVARLIGDVPAADAARVFSILEIGLHHEQQHQELLLTDILHAFAQNPTDPVYDAKWQMPRGVPERGFVEVPRGIKPVGHDGAGFCFDNETPRHDELIADMRIARELVTNAEWLEFIQAGGYTTPSLWLSDGWAIVQAEGWQAPGYWRREAGGWTTMTLARPQGRRSAGAGRPCQLLRGRRFRPLCRQAFAQRSGMGSCGGCGPHRRCLRPGLAMDAERLSTLSGIPGRRRRSWRIQRQVHGEPDGVARLIGRHARRA